MGIGQFETRFVAKALGLFRPMKNDLGPTRI